MTTRTRAFFFLPLGTLLALAACSSDAPTGPGGPNRQEQPAPPKPGLRSHAPIRNDWPVPPIPGAPRLHRLSIPGT